jgi:ABC-2 type transport system permease protein
VAVIQRDPGSRLADLLAASPAVRPIILGPDEMDDLQGGVERGEYAAGLVVPEGYLEGLTESQPARLTLVVKPGSPAGQTAQTALETAANRFQGAVQAALLSAEAYQDGPGFGDQTDRKAYLREGIDLALEAWEDPPLSTASQLAVGEADPDSQNGELNGFVQASSGMIVQFAIFGLINSAMVLVLERKNRTLGRLLTTPISRGEVIGGHLLAMFSVVLLQIIILVLFGQFVFGVNYLRDPLAVLVMIVSLAFWSASLGMLISAVSEGEDQVVTLSLIAMFLFASLGGAWFPLEVAGETFSRIGHLTPTAWAIDGFQNIILRGQGMESVLLPAVILLASGVVFFGLSVWRFRVE